MRMAGHPGLIMNMRLNDKGPIQPPPRLAPRLETVSVEVQGWADVIAATHWNLYARDEVDGADFYVGDRELGHLHLDGEAHIPVSRVLRAPLVDAGLARPFRYGSSASRWIELSIRTTTDAAHALWVFRLNHDRLRGAATAQLLARIATYAERLEGDAPRRDGVACARPRRAGRQAARHAPGLRR
jgi:hypothetical protein